MAAALFRDICAGLVAIEAEIFLLAAGGRLEELILVVGGMRIVTGEAVAHRGRMDRSLDVRGGLVGMAGEAERGRRGGDELDAGHVLIHADLMATKTAGGHGGVHGLALGFVFVAFKALGGVRLGVERHGMDRGGGAHGEQREQGNAQRDAPGKTAAADRTAEIDAMRNQLHTDSEGRILHADCRLAKAAALRAQGT